MLGELGRGGRGIVYRARQARLNRVVALKMLRTADQGDAQELARFQLEGEMLARLRHPHVVQVQEVGVHAGRPYLVMEYTAPTGNCWPRA